MGVIRCMHRDNKIFFHGRGSHQHARDVAMGRFKKTGGNTLYISSFHIASPDFWSQRSIHSITAFSFQSTNNTIPGKQPNSDKYYDGQNVSSSKHHYPRFVCSSQESYWSLWQPYSTSTMETVLESVWRMSIPVQYPRGHSYLSYDRKRCSIHATHYE